MGKNGTWAGWPELIALEEMVRGDALSGPHCRHLISTQLALRCAWRSDAQVDRPVELFSSESLVVGATAAGNHVSPRGIHFSGELPDAELW